MSELPLIHSVFLNVTNACNLSCVYCFVNQQPDYMTFETAKDAAQFLIRNAEQSQTVPSINFFGGEPLLCWDSVIVPLTKFIREEYQKPFSLSMTSNGMLLNEEKLEFMRQNNIGLLLSIDGDRETQDANRPCKNGGSSFDTLHGLLPLVLKYHPHMTFRATLIPATCQNLFHNIMFARDTGYKHYFTVPNVFEPWPDDKKAVVEAELRKYSDYVVASYENGEVPIWLEPYKDYMRKIQHINNAVDKNECRNPNICGACAKCGLGNRAYASIDFKGDLYACQEMVSPKGEQSPFYIGNIYTGVRDDLRSKLADSFRGEDDHGETCRDCKLYRICDGGCVANNFMATGDINKMPETYCWWCRLLLDEAIYVAVSLGNKKNEMFLRDWQALHDGGLYE